MTTTSGEGPRCPGCVYGRDHYLSDHPMTSPQSARGEPLAGLEAVLAEAMREHSIYESRDMTRDDWSEYGERIGRVVRAHLAETLAGAREDVARALGSSRMALGTHADRWTDTEWQGEFWGETADTALSVIAARLGIEGEA